VGDDAPHGPRVAPLPATPCRPRIHAAARNPVALSCGDAPSGRVGARDAGRRPGVRGRGGQQGYGPGARGCAVIRAAAVSQLSRGHGVGPARGAAPVVPCLIHHSSQPRSRTDAGFIAAWWVGLGFSSAFSRAATAACSSLFFFCTCLCGRRPGNWLCQDWRPAHCISSSAHQIKPVQGNLQQWCKNAAL
jgi:hypothetical protein